MNFIKKIELQLQHTGIMLTTWSTIKLIIIHGDLYQVDNRLFERLASDC